MASKKNSKNTIRIIGGNWRGRKLPVLDHEGLRPTQDRIRETVFNWLIADLADARVADLFAGTGALGLEALSRGAASVSFVEKNKRVAQNISANLQLLKEDRASVANKDAQSWMLQQPASSVNLVFLDPPFGLNLVQQILDAQSFKDILAPGAKVYVEREKSCLITTSMELLKEKTTGSLTYSLFSNN